jgi:hypothetical protein
MGCGYGREGRQREQPGRAGGELSESDVEARRRF